MKKFLLSLFYLVAMATSALAQVDNYALTFTQKGRVSVGALSDLDGATAYTVQFWMNPTKWTSGAYIIQRGSTFAVKLGDVHTLNVTVGTETVSFTDSNLKSNTWSHVSLIADGTTLKCYVNNANEQSQTFTTSAMPTATDAVLIGGGFTGRIDEVRIWKCALPSDYERHYRNTVNSLHPNWNNLIAYYKFDQSQLTANVHDYSNNNHDGTFNASGVTKEKVADNTSFSYKKVIAYTNFERFCDRGIEQLKYEQANMLVILGPQLSGSGKIWIPFSHNDGTITGGTQVSDDSRGNVLQLDGSTGCGINAGSSTLYSASAGYAFTAWVKLDSWTAGAYLVQKESDTSNGFSILLGDTEGTIIARINGSEFTKASAITVGEWTYIAVSTNATSGLILNINGSATSWDNTVDSPTYTMSTDALSANCLIGYNIKGQLDNVTTWTRPQGSGSLTNYKTTIPQPTLGGVVSLWPYTQMDAYYKFEDSSKLGYDTWNYTEIVSEMKKAYSGYNGAKILISTGATYNNTSAWKTYIDTDDERTALATAMKNLMDEVDADGVDLDLEWLSNNDAGWTNYGKLCQAIRSAIGTDKVLSCSPHYNYYTFPTDYMQYVDYFFFQMYGPSSALYNYGNYTSQYQTFLNWGYPKEKIVLSYATTTSSGVIEEGGTNTEWGWRNFYTKVDDPDAETISGLTNSVHFTGINQTYNRTLFMRDKDAAGIFYWDMGNDVPSTTNAKSLVRSSAMALASNIDKTYTVTTAADAPEEFSENLGGYYRIRSAETGYTTYYIYQNGDQVYAGEKGSESKSVIKLEKVADSNSNTFYLRGNDGRYIQDRTGMTSTNDVYTFNTTPVSYNIVSYGTATGDVYLQQTNTVSCGITNDIHRCLKRNSADAGVSTWGPWTAASHWFVEEVTDMDVYTISLSGVTSVEYTAEGYTGTTTLYNGGFIAVASGTEISADDITVTVGDGFKKTISIDSYDKIIDITLEVNIPESGKFYRFKNASSGSYICYSNSSISTEAVADKSAESIFYLTSDNRLLVIADQNNYLSNTQTGGWVNGTIGANTTGNEVSFSNSLKETAGAVNIKIGPYTTNDQNMYIYYTADGYLTGNKYNAPKYAVYDWYVEDVTDYDFYTLTLTDAPTDQTITYGGVEYKDGNYIPVVAGSSADDVKSGLSCTADGYFVTYTVDADAKTIAAVFKEKIKAGSYYRLRNVSNSTWYMTANADGGNITANTASAAGDNATLREIWTLQETSEGSGEYYLKNPFMGTAAGKVPSTGGNNSNGLDQPLPQVSNLSEAGTYSLTETADYIILSCTNSGITDSSNDKLSLHSASGNRVVRWTSIHDASHWVVEKISDADLYLLDNWPKAGNFYAFVNNGWGAYMGAGTDGLISGQTNTLTDAQKIFYYDGQYLMAYETGRSVDGVSYSTIGTDGTAVNFVVSSTGSIGGTHHYYWNIRSGNDASSYWKGAWNAAPALAAVSGAVTNWSVEKVSSLPITISSVGYATFSAPVDVTLPYGLQAYVVDQNNTSSVHITEVTDIPANNGVILAGNEGTYNLTIGTASSTIATNFLKPAVAATNITAESGNTAYIFSAVNGVVGFYKMSSNNTISGHKCWLELPTTTGARDFIGIGEDGETGIDTVSPEKKTSTDGKYLENGRVIILKNGIKYNVTGQIVEKE